MKIKLKCFAICFFVTFFAISVQAGTSHRHSIMPADSMLNSPAPHFILKDLNGKTVSLSDYKGKTLVLEFWATWCPYCRKSFPSTQLLLNKYKDDANVKFLFIDTREKKDNYPDLIRKLLNDNHYTFYVVLDEKSADGIQNKIYKQFLPPGIPTRFIIDRKGIIRYRRVDYDPDKADETEIKELSGLIDAVAKL